MTEFNKLTQAEVDSIMKRMVSLKLVSNYGELYFLTDEFATEIVSSSVNMVKIGMPVESALYSGAFLCLIKNLEPIRMNEIEEFFSVIMGILTTQNIEKIKKGIVDLVERKNQA